MIKRTFVEKVIETVRENEACRNSDITLTIELWKRYSPEKIEGDVVRLRDLYELPREDVVKRVRAALCHAAEERYNNGNERPDDYIFFPTSNKIAKQRQINEVVWKKALGYSVPNAPKQTTQLPRPIGGISFRVIEKNKEYEAEGARSEKYKITCYDGIWRCTCGDYKYGGGKSCKHIKEIIKYERQVDAEEAAAHQSKLII